MKHVGMGFHEVYNDQQSLVTRGLFWPAKFAFPCNEVPNDRNSYYLAHAHTTHLGIGQATNWHVGCKLFAEPQDEVTTVHVFLSIPDAAPKRHEENSDHPLHTNSPVLQFWRV